MRDMAAMMERLHEHPPTAIGGCLVLSISDYRQGCSIDCVSGKETVIKLPRSDVLAYRLTQGNVIVRPSGTEPKVKVYLAVKGQDRAEAEKLVHQISFEMTSSIKNSEKA